LPIIRTSVDHGTAFDIVGKGIADPGSLIEAIRLAATLAKRRWRVCLAHEEHTSLKTEPDIKISKQSRI
jgi:hypothetical protein